MSLNTRYTNLNEVLEKVQRDFGFEEVYSQDAKEWIWDAIGLFGTPEMLIQKVSPIRIRNWRGELPVDVVDLTTHQIRDRKSGRILNYSEDSFFLENKSKESDGIVSDNAHSIVYTDHVRDVEFEINYPSIIYPDNVSVDNFGYIIKENFIFTAEKDMDLEISYKAFPMNEKAMEPLIPDDPAILRAITWFIGAKIAFKLMLADKISERKYNMIQQESEFFTGAAITKTRTSSIPEIENIKNRVNLLMQNPFRFQSGFKS